VEPTTERVASILDAAKVASHVLSDEEINLALARSEKQEYHRAPVSQRSRRAAVR
jgi:hypothetical protein